MFKSIIAHTCGGIPSYVLCRPRQVLSLLIHLFCRTHWQILSLLPFWRYSQSGIGIVTYTAPFEGCIISSLTHAVVFTFTDSAHWQILSSPPFWRHLLLCCTHWQILLSSPFRRYSQSRILLSSTGIVTHIKSIIAHTCGGIPSYVFYRPWQVLSLLIYLFYRTH